MKNMYGWRKIKKIKYDNIISSTSSEWLEIRIGEYEKTDKDRGEGEGGGGGEGARDTETFA